jgi:hypothetical protein
LSVRLPGRAPVVAEVLDEVEAVRPNGGTITLGIDGSTTYHQQEAASASNMSTGQTVIVELAGGRGFGGGPAASGVPGTSGAGAFATARDITIAAP